MILYFSKLLFIFLNIFSQLSFLGQLKEKHLGILTSLIGYKAELFESNFFLLFLMLPFNDFLNPLVFISESRLLILVSFIFVEL